MRVCARVSICDRVIMIMSIGLWALEGGKRKFSSRFCAYFTEPKLLTATDYDCSTFFIFIQTSQHGSEIYFKNIFKP